jgi:hypothetical protein
VTDDDAALTPEPEEAIREIILVDLIGALSVNCPPEFVVRSGRPLPPPIVDDRPRSSGGDSSN